MFQRQLQPELMDDPRIGRADHVAALNGLSRVQWISRTASVFWPFVRREYQQADRSANPLRVLDLASGGGDLPVALARRAASAGLSIEFAGCDISRQAIAVARLRARRARARVRFFRCDLLADGVPDGFDVVMCSLFLHHLTSAQAARLLESAGKVARRQVLIDDLRRCRTGLVATAVGTRLLSLSRVVHVDGLRSVRAAFTPSELGDLAMSAGLEGCSIHRHWPWRQLLVWTSHGLPKPDSPAAILCR